MATTRRAYTGGATSTTTTSAIAASGTTSFTITAYTGWPYGTDPFFIVVEPGTASEEKILVTRTGSTDTTINIASDSERAQDGTSAVAHSSGSVVFPVFTALDADEANELTSSWSTKGDLVSYGSSTFETLGVGSDGQFLRADSGETSGLAWESYTNTLGSGSVVRTLGTFAGGEVLQAAELNQFNNVTALYGSTTTVPNATATAFQYTSTGQVLVDTSDWHSTSSNPSRITVDKDGIYLVGAFCQFAYSGATVDFSIGISRNGATLIDGNAQADFYPGVTAVGILDATAGQYFEAVAYQTSGSARSVWSGRQGFYCMLLRTT